MCVHVFSYLSWCRVPAGTRAELKDVSTALNAEIRSQR